MKDEEVYEIRFRNKIGIEINKIVLIKPTPKELNDISILLNELKQNTKGEIISVSSPSGIIEFDPNYNTHNDQLDAAISIANSTIENYYQSKISTIPTIVKDLVDETILEQFEDKQNKGKIKYNGMSKKAFLKYIFPGLKYKNRKFENFYNLFTK